MSLRAQLNAQLLLAVGQAVRDFENAGVGMSPGRDFGDNQFMRLNFGCPRSRLEKAVGRIRAAVENRA